MSTQPIPGIHHITAIAADPQGNLDFYTQVMGFRLVKLTVNFDDPGTYHFYFGNESGTPGSILTFFPWPGARSGVIGAGQVVAIAFAVRIESLAFWIERLHAHGFGIAADEERFGDRVVRFRDPDGLWLELVATPHPIPILAWQAGPVPAAHALHGFHSASLSEASHHGTATLIDAMGYKLTGQEGNRFRYRAAGQAAAILDVLHEPKVPPGQLGAGAVHHIAFRTPTDEQQHAWRRDLVARGYRVTPVIDRMYFHSIYFHEPGGVLFEIATDPPGFIVDEAQDRLGDRLTLPHWLEPRRHELEAHLPSLTRHQAGTRVPRHVESAAD